jgi:DNA-binding response OmpR family regulator
MRILVVEDEHRIANTIKKGLEQERYAVDVTYNGTEGYDMAASGDYDAIILDLMLPEKGGLEISRDLREQQIHTPILILTAKSQLQDKVTGLDMGADDYLTKPFSFEELIARIRALTRRPPNSLGLVLQIADLKLDSNSYLVYRNKNKINLSNKEFSILEYLMRNKGRIISKDQIINHVWDYNADILPNTVEVNIKNLRAKVDRSYNRKLIHTVRGFGYKMGE